MEATAFHMAASGDFLPIVEVLIELELNPFDHDKVSRSCCVSMTVVCVDSGIKRQEI